MSIRIIILAVTVIWLLSACSIAAIEPRISVVHRDKQGVVSVDIALKITEVEKGPDSGIKITASGFLENKLVGFAFTVPPRWEVHPMSKPDRTMHRFWPKFVRSGASSDALDAVLREIFRLKSPETIFKPLGYDAVTLTPHEQLEHSKVQITVGDPAVEGKVVWRFVIDLDVPNKAMKLTLREPSL